MKQGFLSVLFLGFAFSAFSQYSLTFCKNVSAEGKPEMATNLFTAAKTGSKIKMLFKSDAKFTASQLEYRVFYIDGAGKETELSKLSQNVEPNWDFVWKEVMLYDAGTYRIRIYDDKGLYLTSANVNLKN